MEERDINKRELNDNIYKLSVVLVIFAVVLLMMSGVISYLQQMHTYRDQCMQNSRDLGEYLEAMIMNEKDYFLTYQKHMKDYYDKELVPYDFDEFITARKNFEKAYTSTYPGKVLGEIDFEDMDEEVQKAYLIYQHEYWTLTFEKAREAFDIPYTYYLEVNEDDHEVIYLIDGERTEVAGNDGKSYLYLGDTYYNDPAQYKVEWATWETGEMQNEYQEWDNAWGHTYSYYVPLIIDGEKMGLIGAEVNVEAINNKILNNTARHLFGLAIILVISEVVLINYIKRVLTRQYEKYGQFM